MAQDNHKSPSASPFASPWLRRSSFLSPTMIQSEDISIYETPNFMGGGNHSIISLKEAQGFIFNQDLFASPYQQLQAAARERRLRAASFSDQKRSTKSALQQQGMDTRRRHTSYDSRRPVFVTSYSRMDHNENDDEDDDVFMDTVEDESDEDSDDNLDEYDEVEDDGHYGGSSGQRYKVHVTEIVVDNDNSIFPD